VSSSRHSMIWSFEALMVERIFVYKYSLGCAGLGYLAGPTIGTLLFKVFNGNKNKSMELMDKR